MVDSKSCNHPQKYQIVDAHEGNILLFVIQVETNLKRSLIIYRDPCMQSVCPCHKLDVNK